MLAILNQSESVGFAKPTNVLGPSSSLSILVGGNSGKSVLNDLGLMEGMTSLKEGSQERSIE